MNTVTLSPLQKQVYQVQPQQSHPSVSLRRVLWIRFLRWIDKASPQAIWKATKRASTLLLISVAYFVPQFLLGFLTSAARFGGYRILLFLALLYGTLNARRLWFYATSRGLRKSAGNQFMYHGLPVSELCSFLKENESFKLKEATATFRISEDKWRAIAEDLEEKGVLTRGEKNARVLRPISYVNLVRQLSEKFPLIWDDTREIWVERDGQFARWTLANEFKQRKITEQQDRKERKLEKLQDKIEESKQHPLFASLQA